MTQSMTPLEWAIKLWRENVKKAKTGALTVTDLSPDKDALCQAHPRGDCAGCPVRNHTGKNACRGTPYYKVVRALSKGNDAKVIAQSKAMLALLKKIHDQLDP